ncbi:unnamed protein product [Lathyrus oleraceus]
MVKIQKFFYSFIIFLSLNFLVTSYNLKYCTNDKDCPTMMCFLPDVSKCVWKTCYCVQKHKKKLKKKKKLTFNM